LYIFSPLACVHALLLKKIHKNFQDFVGISFVNPHGTSFMCLGEPIGLKGLSHMLNTIMISMKVS